jgi:hypothetical protein
MQENLNSVRSTHYIKHNPMRLNTITLNMINYEAKRKLDTSVVIWSRIRMDLHHFDNMDPHQIEKSDPFPEPNQGEKWDPDPNPHKIKSGSR